MPRRTWPVVDQLPHDVLRHADGDREADADVAAGGREDLRVDADQLAAACSTSAPPELPWLIGASVWMKSSKCRRRRRSRGPCALTMPIVTVWPTPSGLPIASTTSPTRTGRSRRTARVGRPVAVDLEHREVARRVGADDASPRSCGRRSGRRGSCRPRRRRGCWSGCSRPPSRSRPSRDRPPAAGRAAPGGCRRRTAEHVIVKGQLGLVDGADRSDGHHRGRHALNEVGVRVATVAFWATGGRSAEAARIWVRGRPRAESRPQACPRRPPGPPWPPGFALSECFVSDSCRSLLRCPGILPVLFRMDDRGHDGTVSRT